MYPLHGTAWCPKTFSETFLASYEDYDCLSKFYNTFLLPSKRITTESSSHKMKKFLEKLEMFPFLVIKKGAAFLHDKT